MADVHAPGSAARREQDIQMMLAAQCHLGTRNCTNAMKRYVFRRNGDTGVHVIDLNKTYAKLRMAAQVIVAIENPQDVYVLSARPYGQRAVFKFSQLLHCKMGAGRFTPGTFTNQIQKHFEEPRLLIVTDPRTDQQPVREASYMGIPCIAFVDTDSPLEHVDIAIPCNNKSRHAIGLMWYLLARMVLEMHGTVSAEKPFDVPVDLFFYREPEEVEGGEEAGAEAPGFGTAADFGAGGFDFGALPGERAGEVVAPGAADDSWGVPPAEGYGGASAFEAADFTAPAPLPDPNVAFGGGFGGGFEVSVAPPPAPAPAAGDWE